jgi:integrase/recombinase XerD
MEDYITTTKQPSGKVVYYLRLPKTLSHLPGYGQKLRMPGTPGSPEWRAFYRATLSGEQSSEPVKRQLPTPKLPGGVRMGSLRALVVDYLQSAEYRSMDAAPAKHRRRYLEEICASTDHVDKTRTRADLDVLKIRRSDCVAIHTDAAWLDFGTSTADSRLIALRTLFSWAVLKDRMAGNPAAKIKLLRSDDDTHDAWTADDCERYKRAHPVGTMARLAFDIFWTTGVRRSDCYRLGPQHFEAGLLEFTEYKGARSKALMSKGRFKRKERQLPMTAELAQSIIATRKAMPPKRHKAQSGKPYGKQLVFLLDDFGNPFNCGRFGKAMRAWTTAAGLKGKSAHGIRHAVGNRLAEEGKSEKQIANFLGHTSLQHVRRYTLHADKLRMAHDAIGVLGTKANASLLREVA